MSGENVRYVSGDENMDYTPAADVTAGDVLVLGDIVAVACHDIKTGFLGSLRIEGIFDFPKSTAVGSGQTKGLNMWYWDATNKVATINNAGNNPIGFSVADCADADTTVRINLDEYQPVQVVPQALSADGAIAVANGKYVITKGSLAALTLAGPTAGTDDGKEIEVTSDTAFAHTITLPAGKLKTGGAAATICTFTGTTGGGGIKLKAYNGTWKVLAQQGVAFS